jgi:nucleotide-binding universal stress UspA family protein
MKAAAYSLKLATATGAKLTAVCVVQIPEYIEESIRGNLRKELFGKSEKTLAEVGQLASRSKVRFTSKVLETSGAIATAICKLASEEAVDLIVLGTRANTSSLSKMMLGSVASGVASNADCPVLVVR